MSEKIDFGEVITIFRKRPIKFHISLVKLRATSYDPTREWIAIYEFTKSRVSSGLEDVTDFAVKLQDQVPDVYFAHNENNPGLHVAAIAYGLWFKKNNVNVTEAALTKTEFENFTKSVIPSGGILTQKVLEFIYLVNREWPIEAINVFDLEDNFYDKRQEIREAWVYWHKTGYFQEKGLVPYRKNRGGGSTPALYIKPQKMTEIRALIKDFLEERSNTGEINVFLSYNSFDKHLAGKVKAELSKYGLKIFLAHEDIEPSDEWREIIQKNLNDCDVFLMLLTDNCKNSNWTDQECGQAYSKEKFIIPIKVTRDPYGFIEKFQAVTLNEEILGAACVKIKAKIEQKFNTPPLIAS